MTGEKSHGSKFAVSWIRYRCQNLEHETTFSVDECMVRYKGTFAGNLRQYMPAKPSCKWGFKLFVLAGISGITYDFIPYCGSYTFHEEPLTKQELDLGVGASAVIALCRSIPHPEVSTVTFHNWYTGVPLVTYLKKEMSLHSLGTIKTNRLSKDCHFTDNKIFKKKPRGTFESQVNADGVVAIKWLDSKPIHLVSTLVGVQPCTEIVRYVKESKSKIPVPCPRAIKVYNSNMGGVDLSDMLMSLYRIPSKSSRRYYFPMLGYLLDMCLTNAWLLYRRDCSLLRVRQEIGTSKDFRLHVSGGIAVGCQRKKGRPSLDRSLSKSRVEPKSTTPRPVDDLRCDGFEHWPEIAEKGRCRYCSKLTKVTCTKCSCRLCFTTDRNCFVQFHLQKKLSSRKKNLETPPVA